MRIEDIMAWGEAKMRYTDEYPLERGFRYHHGLRVAGIAEQLAEELGRDYDRETLFLSAYLHDVGKAGYSGPDHGPRGAELIRSEALTLFDSRLHEGVLNAVANHYMRPNSSWLEGSVAPTLYYETLLVQDADILDHFGVNALWSAIRWSAHEGLGVLDTIEKYNGEAKWQDEARRSLNFGPSRAELARRIRLQDSIYAAWLREQEGPFMAMNTLTGDEQND